MIIVKNYDRGICGVIDKFPQFTATCNHLKKELKLTNHKHKGIETFESFEAFVEYMKNRKDGEE